MKLIDKDALVAEIERRIKTNKECMLGLRNLDYYQGKVDALNDTLSYIDSMQEEPKKCMYTKDNYTDKDRRVLCEGCEEECRFSRKGLNTSERELIATSEALAYVNNINRGESPWTDSDMEEAYEEGYKAGGNWQKQQMMKDAADGVITFDYYKDDKAYGCVAHDSFCLEERGLRDCDKVKIIVVKED